jgi:hypothetical protein
MALISPSRARLPSSPGITGAWARREQPPLRRGVVTEGELFDAKAPEEDEMAEISFLASQRRLVVSGPCATTDSDAIVEAIEVFAGLADPLVLDVTGVTGLQREVAVSVLEACRNAERVGHLVAIHAVDEDVATGAFEGDRAARARPRGLERC